MLEPNVYGLWGAKQPAKGTLVAAASATRRFKQVAGDFNMPRDDGSEPYSDLTKYGSATDFVNTFLGNGEPGIEATPVEIAWGLWMHHGSEAVVGGTNNVWTLAGSPASGAFVLLIDSPFLNKIVTVPSQAATVTSAALATAINTAMTTAGHTGTPVVTGGGPLNTTPITITFSGVDTGARPFTITKTADTTAPSVTVTNTTPGVKPKHTCTPQPGRGFYGTFFKRLGQAQIQRQTFGDSLITRTQIEGSTANKAVRWTPRILSLSPGIVSPTTDPTNPMPTLNPFLYTDGTGTFTIDGLVVRGHSQFTLVLDEDLSPAYGDDTIPWDLTQGTPVATIGCTIFFDADGQAEYNQLVYGTATPAVAQAPLKTIPALGSYSFDLKARTAAGNLSGDELKLTIPGVKWTVPDAPGPAPGGGPTELALAGSMRTVAALQPYTIDTWCDSLAFTG